MSNSVLAIVVPHTHWDREWYLSFQEYRHRLVKVMRKVIKLLTNDPRFKSFTLDGQVAALEDYLEIEPEMERVVRNLVASGRLLIGPLYTQPDEFLVSGEALIRNFLYGMRRAARFGGYMKVAYLPDTFGHTAQLPQILRGLGFDSFVFMRGMGDEEDELGTEFLWEAPDGSRVLAIYLAKGYCCANMLGIEGAYSQEVWRGPEGWYTVFLNIYFDEPEPDVHKAAEQLRELAEYLLPRSKSRVLLVMNGCDHMPPQERLPDLVEKLSSEGLGLELKIGSLENYVKCVRSRVNGLKVYRGELRGAKTKPILAGVLSSRAYLKRLNYRAQLLLEKYAEPLAAIATLYGYEYPSALLEKAWRLLFLNHAHDSIYGSGTDCVHVENESRFFQVIEIASSIAYESAKRIASSLKEGQGRSLFVFNPLSWPRRDVVEFLVKAEDAESGLCLVDGNGKKYPVQVVARDEYYEGYKLVAAVVNVPSLGFSTYRIESCDEPEVRVDDGCVIENEYFRVEVNPERGGSIRLVDKRTGRVFDGLNVFVSEGDAGDEYNYSPPREGAEPVVSTDFKALVERTQGPVFSRLRVSVEMTVPEGLQGQKRSTRRVVLPVTTEIYLFHGVPRVDVRTVVINTARDHRFRVKFPTGLVSDHTVAETHFYAIRRPLRPLSSREGWVEEPPRTHPQMAWVSVSDGENGLTLANRGIPEYEALIEEGQVTLYLTLFRSVGWLSRGDLLTRKGHAGPAIKTPGAQCLREMTFEYSIIPHRGDWLKSSAYKLARDFYEPLLALVAEGSKPQTKSVLEVEPHTLVLTAFKRAETGNSLVARIYNITGEPVAAIIRAGFQLQRAWLADLRETPTEELGGRDGVRVDVGGHKIVTLILKP